MRQLSRPWTRPHGGFFVWLQLPEGLDAAALLPSALAGGVAYVPGTGFFADGRGQRYLRLSFSGPSSRDIRDGVRRLAGVLADEPADQTRRPSP